jgi:anthranilate synthase
MHGKSSRIQVIEPSPLFDGLSPSFLAGRYHSLYAKPSTFPDELIVTAKSESDDIIMAVSHRTLPIHAVQFHPETILSLPQQAGIRIIHNLIRMLK